MNKIKHAMLLAEFVHAFQLRQDNEPYINHVIRVSEMVKEDTDDENLIIASILHDVLEDGEKSITVNLIKDYFGIDVLNLVLVLTHEKDHESYNEYITRVFKNETAWVIKFKDMIDNTSYNIPDKQRTKYRDACVHLMAHGVKPPIILQKRLEL